MLHLRNPVFVVFVSNYGKELTESPCIKHLVSFILYSYIIYRTYRNYTHNFQKCEKLLAKSIVRILLQGNDSGSLGIKSDLLASYSATIKTMTLLNHSL